MQAEAGGVAEAKQTLSALTNAKYKAEALAAIAQVQAKSGDIAGAKQTLTQAEQASDPISADEKSLTLTAIAQAQTNSRRLRWCKNHH